MRAFASIAVFAFAGLASAQAPSADAIKLVLDQFKGALIVPGVIAEFAPKGIVTADFGATVGKITNGKALTTQESATEPTISFAAPADAYAAVDSPLSRTTTNFTMMLVDGDYPGAPTDPQGINAHWISNGWGYGGVTNGVLTFKAPTIDPIIKYAGPGPASGSGPHRYIFLVFPEPEGYTAPAVPPAGGSVTRIRYNEYTDGLSAPVGGVYFTCEVGTATVAVSSTTPIAAAPTTAASGATSAGPAAGTASRSSASASSTAAGSTPAPNSATKAGTQLTGAAVAGAAVFLAASLFA